MKILVIEDDRAMVDLYRQWLMNTNAEIDYCDNSYKASEKIMKGFREKCENLYFWTFGPKWPILDSFWSKWAKRDFF